MRRDWHVILLLAGVTLAVFWPVSQCDFVNYDDNNYVTDNVYVQAGLTGEGLAWAFGRLHGEATYWHPLTWVSHMLDCQLFGLKPAGHHLVNLFFHILNTVLVFVVFKRLTGAFWRCAVLAALFALHPLQVDTVAWVSERKNVLSTFFWLLTMAAYARYAAKPGWGRYGLMLLPYVLGLMSKPILVTLPFALLLLDYWPLRRWQYLRPVESSGSAATEKSHAPPGTSSTGYSLGRLVLEKLPMLALATAVSVITVMAHNALGIKQSAFGLTLLMRLENAWFSYVRYLGKVLWPANLAVFYPHPGQWPAWQVQGSLLILLAISTLVVWQARRRPYLFVGWFWFLGVLVPASGILQAGLQAMADRFVYVPLLGLFLMGVWGITELTKDWPSRPLFLGAATAALLASLAICTRLQLRYWRDSIALFEHAVAVTWGNFIAYHNLAVAYTIQGDYPRAWQYESETLRVRPDLAEGRLQMGYILTLQGKLDEAAEQYRLALTLRPGWVDQMMRLGIGLIEQGRLQKAIDQFLLVLKLSPNQTDAHCRLGMLYSACQQPAEAVQHYREALRLQPDSTFALNNLAWLLATHPDPQLRNGAEAVQLAQRAVEVTKHKQAVFVGTLAAALAEAGRVEEAVAAAQEAMRLAQAAKQNDLVERNRKLLSLYQARQPAREDKL